MCLQELICIVVSQCVAALCEHDQCEAECDDLHMCSITSEAGRVNHSVNLSNTTVACMLCVRNLWGSVVTIP